MKGSVVSTGARIFVRWALLAALVSWSGIASAQEVFRTGPNPGRVDQPFVLLFEGTANHPYSNPSGISAVFDALQAPGVIVGGEGNAFDNGVAGKVGGLVGGTTMDHRAELMVKAYDNAYAAGYRNFVVAGFSRGGETARIFFNKLADRAPRDLDGRPRMDGATFSYYEQDGVPGMPRMGSHLPSVGRIAWARGPDGKPVNIITRSLTEKRVEFDMTYADVATATNLGIRTNHWGSSTSISALDHLTRWLQSRGVTLNTTTYRTNQFLLADANGTTKSAQSYVRIPYWAGVRWIGDMMGAPEGSIPSTELAFPQADYRLNWRFALPRLPAYQAEITVPSSTAEALQRRAARQANPGNPYSDYVPSIEKALPVVPPTATGSFGKRFKTREEYHAWLNRPHWQYIMECSPGLPRWAAGN